MTDTDAEPSKAELIEKVEQLESEQQSLKSQLKKMMPSRRDMLKGGAAAGAVLGGVSLASESTDAATGSAGTIGSSSDRPDIFADTVDANQVSGNIKNIAGDRLYAGEFSGNDADSRLDSALSGASSGDTIFLENATYTNNRTISKDCLILKGTAYKPNVGSGTVFQNQVTLNGTGTSLMHTRLTDTLTMNQRQQTLTHSNCGIASVTVNADRCLISLCDNLDVTFSSGTQNGIVNSCTGTTVTDNGSNNVGTIS